MKYDSILKKLEKDEITPEEALKQLYPVNKQRMGKKAYFVKLKVYENRFEAKYLLRKITHNFDDLTNSYETMEQSNQYISSITLLDLAGNAVVSRTDKVLEDDLDTLDWFSTTLEDSSIYHFSEPHKEDVYKDGFQRVISVSKEIPYYSDNIEKTGILIIELKVTNFEDLSEKTNLGENGHIVIVDEDYCIY